MSYLYRSGNGRNNIAYTTTANSSTKYLRRLGSGRTNINWYTIPQGSTYNILNRTGTGRNNIAWANLNIPKPVGEPVSTSNVSLIFAAFSGSTVLTSGNLYLPFKSTDGKYGVRIVLNSNEGDNGISGTGTMNTTNRNLVLINGAEGVYNPTYTGDLSCSGGDEGANLWNLPNVKKITIWQGSEYITFHTTITVELIVNRFQSDITYSEYKTNISLSLSGTGIQQRNQLVNYFKGKSRTITFSNTW